MQNPRVQDAFVTFSPCNRSAAQCPSTEDRYFADYKCLHMSTTILNDVMLFIYESIITINKYKSNNILYDNLIKYSVMFPLQL